MAQADDVLLRALAADRDSKARVLARDANTLVVIRRGRYISVTSVLFAGGVHNLLMSRTPLA